MKMKKIVLIWGLCCFAVSVNAEIVLEGVGSISKIKRANVLVVTNTYANLLNMKPLLGAAKDAMPLNNNPNTLIVQNATSELLSPLFGLFGLSDCQDRKEARIIWLSGYSYTISNPDTYIYSFLGNEPFDAQTKKGAYDINRLLIELSSSSCKFVVGIDADPPNFRLSLPRNVTIIWASELGGQAKDTVEGGVLTLAFNKAYATNKTWTANTLTSFLRTNTAQLASSQPWVQSVHPDDTIYFPTADTSEPVIRVVPIYPTLYR
jgi:hypothetical protein